jgi:lysylphosphatidylglycerol synthetase-like protein (DUF2156 family)
VGYQVLSWRDFGEALAALSGALTGLLFVAVSIKSDVLARSRHLGGRAAQTLVLFMTSVIVSVVLVAPQPRPALGPELIATAVASAVALIIFNRRAGRVSKTWAELYLDRASPNLITALMVGVAGLTFILRAGGGLYWLVPAVVASLAGGVINAWLFLIKVD